MLMGGISGRPEPGAGAAQQILKSAPRPGIEPASDGRSARLGGPRPPRAPGPIGGPARARAAATDEGAAGGGSGPSGRFGGLSMRTFRAFGPGRRRCFSARSSRAAARRRRDARQSGGLGGMRMLGECSFCGFWGLGWWTAAVGPAEGGGGMVGRRWVWRLDGRGGGGDRHGVGRKRAPGEWPEGKIRFSKNCWGFIHDCFNN
ncbi:hypothetical protein Zmor_004794 [Zophobas morio]|uniref:Uncharacterized protein n=1 Tax=Zophobas morio TaxID=2755281 RepID=A0AA38IUV8_9CUCU|nr:hypothetical protein Zmor_004794 [Zophobas morio]